MSDETDALLDAYYDAAVRWGECQPNARLDCEIAEGKLRGHIAAIEARAERAERELCKVEERLNAAGIGVGPREHPDRLKLLAHCVDMLARQRERAERERDAATKLAATHLKCRENAEKLMRGMGASLERHRAWAERWKELARLLRIRSRVTFRGLTHFSDKADSARAWARRWKRAAKSHREDYLASHDVRSELRARLEKWRTAERRTGEEPLPPPCRGIRITHWARVPEGEE